MIIDFFKAPVFSDDEGKTRRAELLHYGSLLLFVFPLLLISFNLLFGSKAENSINWVLGSIVALQILIQRMIRRGFVNVASLILLVISWAAMTEISRNVDGIRDVAIMGYVLILLASGYLLGWRAATLFTLVSVATVWWLAYIETMGFIAPSLGNPNRIALDLTAIFILVFLVIYFILSTLTKSLEKAQRELAERLRAEKSLESEQERLRLALNSSRMGTWDWNIETGIVLWSDKIESMFGLKNGEFDGRHETYLSYIHPEDRSTVENAIQRSLADKDSDYFVEHRLIWPNGEVRWLEGRGKVYRDGIGKPFRMAGTVVDITERKTSEEALRRTEEKYRSIVENAIDGIFQSTLDGRFISVNPAMAHMYGYESPEEMINSITDIASQLYVESDQRSEMQSRLETGEQITNFESLDYRKDKSMIWISMNVQMIRDEYDKTFYYEGTVEDISLRKKAEEELQMFQYSIDQATDAIFWINRDGGFLYVNEKACRLLGYTREELILLSLWDIDPVYPVEQWNANWEEYQEGRQGGGGYMETLHRRKDGSTCPVEVYSNHLWLGERELHVAVVRDITERKQAEKELQQRESYLRAILDNFPFWVWLKDAQSRFLAVNKPLARGSGYDQPEMLVGRTDFDITSAELAGKYQHDDRSVMDSRMQRVVEEAIIENGIETWIETFKSPIFDPQGNVIGTTGFVRYITERKRVEALANLRIRLFEFAVNHSLEELLQKTLDEVSELTGSLIGFYHFVEEDQNTLSLQAWSTRTLTEFCHAEGLGAHYSLDQAGVWADSVREQRIIIHNDYPGLADRKGLPPGHANVVRELVVPIKRGDRIVAVLGVGNKPQKYTDRDAEIVSYLADVTWELAERKHAETEREKLITELETKNAELERFTYTVSHDLKSPLVTIRGFLGFVEQDAQSGNITRLKGDIQRIGDAADKMQSLLNELLELSRIGRMLNTPEAVLFFDLVREAMANVHGQLEASRVTVQIHSNLTFVYGDHQRLVEVVQNLIDNAAKYMGDKPNPRIEIGERGEENGLPVFYIKDNGIGIAPEHHERIFELFSQLDPQKEGTGIGLAIVKRIIELHGGRVWVESEGMEKGSTFCFTLPRSKSG